MKKIFLMLVPILLVMLAFRPVRSLTVAGTITDEKGSVVPGITILIKGTRTGVTTDNKGSYSIVVPGANSVLVFSGVGFETKEEKVNGRTIINVSLKTIVVSNTEVIVTALGQKRQAKELSYSTAKVKAAELTKASPVNLQNGLTGRVAGLNVDKDGDGVDDHYAYDREGYDHIIENQFLKTDDNPLSTFSIDVDAASYSNIRRFLNQGQLPPAGAVRIEEMVNYFHYEYPQPINNDPFSINTEISDCPWNKNNKLVLIGLQGKKIPTKIFPLPILFS